jgi:hypothetical protein
MIKPFARTVARHLGYTIQRVPTADPPSVYAEDGLRTAHCHDFIDEPRFAAAYAVGQRAMGDAYHAMHWRAHIVAWCGRQGARLDGDFVECGVSHGFMSAMLMRYLDWDRLGKTFWLLDTFAGIDPAYVNDAERASGILEKTRSRVETGEYATTVADVRATFASWRNVKFVVGPVPATLPQVTSRRIAYLHIDMNCAAPERAAIECFWDRLVPGAFVVLDDYGWGGYEEQKRAMDEFAASRGVEILRVPTGQGLLQK